MNLIEAAYRPVIVDRWLCSKIVLEKTSIRKCFIANSYKC